MKAVRVVRGVLYADGAGIFSLSPQGFTKVMAVIVEVSKEFDLTVLEKTTETTCMPAGAGAPEKVEIQAAGQEYTQTKGFKDVGGSISKKPNVTVHVPRQPPLPANLLVLQALQGSALRPTQHTARAEIRMTKAEAIETLLALMRYVDDSKTALQQARYRQPRDAAARYLLSPNSRTNHTVSYQGVLELAGRQSIEATVRKRRTLWARSVGCSAAQGLYRRVILGELERPSSKEGEEDRVVPRGRKKQRNTCINNNLGAFGVIGD